MVAWALMAPAERQLGDGIRLVYLHVSATWAGLMGIYGAGLLGVAALAVPSRIPDGWARALGGAGLVIFSVGFVVSLASAHVSWGGILWVEPRLLASAGIIALGSILTWATQGVEAPRVTGMAWLGFAVVTSVSLQAAGLFFHPDEPIASSPSDAIRWTFFGLFGLATVALFLLVSLLRPEPGESSG
jgi:hypothetical protein